MSKIWSQVNIIFKETTKKVVKAIEPSDIVKSFLQDIKVEEPMEYVRTICSASTANYPVYYLLQQDKVTIEEAIEIVEKTTSRLVAKKNLLERLQGKRILKGMKPTLNTDASIIKRKYREQWIGEKLEPEEEIINYVLAAFLSLDDTDIIAHQKYIKRQLLSIYNKYYETAKSTVATDIRKSICRVDEVLCASEV